MPYVNNNPRATLDEIRIGEFLDNKAQAGELPGVIRVEGAAEIPGTRSGDYRFIHPDGSQTSTDLMQPQTRPIRSIAQNIIEKSSQAEIVVVELSLGESSQIGIDQALTWLKALSAPLVTLSTELFLLKTVKSSLMYRIRRNGRASAHLFVR